VPRDYKNARRKPAKKPLPGWVWMLSGLLIGLLIAFLVYLSQQPGMSDKFSKASPEPAKVKTAVKKPAQKSSEKAKDNGLRYEFYTVLPESEIVIPEQELLQREKSRPSSQQKKHAYILQAGSFRNKQQAETLKARLALLGIESSVDKVLVHGDAWHRIRIGPFVSIREINSTRNRLRNNDINAILIRAR
jgi:cell division protein FtsN